MWQFCRENNRGIVRKAAGTLEHPFLLLGEQQEEALHYQGHQIKDCLKNCLSLLHLFLKAGQVSTKPISSSSLPTLFREGCSSCYTSWAAWLDPQVKPSSWPHTMYVISSAVKHCNSKLTLLLPARNTSLNACLLVANCADERGQTDRQKDKQTDRQTDRQTDIHKYRETDRQTETFLSQNWFVPPLLGKSCCSWTNLV